MIPGLENQAREFLFSGLGGLLLGFFYDGCRSWRRVFPRLGVPAELLFLLSYGLLLFFLTVYTGGLRFYELLGMLLAATLWHLTFSGPLIRIRIKCLLWFRRLLGRLWQGTKKSAKFLRNLAKKFFPSREKWSTIGAVPFLPPRKDIFRGDSRGKNSDP